MTIFKIKQKFHQFKKYFILSQTKNNLCIYLNIFQKNHQIKNIFCELLNLNITLKCKKKKNFKKEKKIK